MKLIGLGVLDTFCIRHADCRKWISNWISDVRASSWKTSQDIKGRYSTASFLAENIVIFNVRGNEYRLETQVAYNAGVVVVKWAGTHEQYTKRMR
ncbi:type II toxin-antitoxin system HigB family toxin [Massilia orientalis]|uniref:Type II toxin-antitoxin system HigB family toxin n=1 Tax=Massilia orientalis TaxID=3050128 RepID=A0ACC7MGP3_9BURK|nr:type II toxin-antitoxin system HigB family toxin [Massilia sp. YIM B02787]